MLIVRVIFAHLAYPPHPLMTSNLFTSGVTNLSLHNPWITQHFRVTPLTFPTIINPQADLLCLTLKFHPSCFTLQVPPSRFQPSGSTFQVLLSMFHPPSVSAFKYQSSGSTLQVPPSRFDPPGSTLQVPPSRFHPSGSNLQAPIFRAQLSGSILQAPPSDFYLLGHIFSNCRVRDSLL